VKLDANSEDQRVCRIAALTLANAMIFQEVLARSNSRVNTLRQCIERLDPISAFIETWNLILKEIDYVPIFQVARDILISIPSGDGAWKAIRALAQVVLNITQQHITLRHDLMGRIYHRLLADAKYYGAFYTTIPAATLLLKLTIEQAHWEINWSDLEQIRNLKIADLACGTGTLLKAAQKAIIDEYVQSSVTNERELRLSDLHRILMEEVLFGFDVLPFAVHLSASTLALNAPDVPFRGTGLYSLPIGGPECRLGSLDFFQDKTIRVHAHLFAGLIGPRRVTGYGDETISITLPDLDLCVMNPPFTRSVGGNLLFGQAPAFERKRMQKRLQKIVGKCKTELAANITAGLGSVFVALGDRYLKDGGHMSLVLPKALLSGVAWTPTRQLLASKYHIRYIIVSHEPYAWNFSENTNLSEILLIAKKQEQKVEKDNTTFINLWQKPRTSLEALALVNLIESATPGSLQGNGGICELSTNGRKFGEALSVSATSMRSEPWIYGASFAQTDLCRAAYHLIHGKLYLPSKGIAGEVPLVELYKIGKLGPDRRDIHDGFNRSRSVTSYPAFWGHDSKKVRTIAQQPNAYLSPLTKAKTGRSLRSSKVLWQRAGRLLIAERLRLNTDRITAIVLPEPALANVWWPLRIKTREEKNVTPEETAQILGLWLNSTFGLLTLLASRVETEGAWIDLKKPILSKLPVLEPVSLNENQLEELLRA